MFHGLKFWSYLSIKSSERRIFRYDKNHYWATYLIYKGQHLLQIIFAFVIKSSHQRTWTVISGTSKSIQSDSFTVHPQEEKYWKYRQCVLKCLKKLSAVLFTSQSFNNGICCKIGFYFIYIFQRRHNPWITEFTCFVISILLVFYDMSKHIDSRSMIAQFFLDHLWNYDFWISCAFSKCQPFES